MTDREIDAVAPNIAQRMYLLRPTPGFANPALCTLAELRTVYTLDDLADFHEILDLRQAASQKVERFLKQAEEAAKRRGKRRN